MNLKSPLHSQVFLCVYASPHLNFRSREPVSVNMVRNYASGKPSNSLSRYNLFFKKDLCARLDGYAAPRRCRLQPQRFSTSAGPYFCDSLYLTMTGNHTGFIVQELCESRGGRPGLSVLTSLLVSVDVKNFIAPCFGIGHNLSLICQLTSEDIKHHFINGALWRER